jgi:hypothetical protein
MFDNFLYCLSQSPRARNFFTVLARGYIRYTWGMPGKEALRNRVVNPYLAWQSREFVAPTRFGQWLTGNTWDMIQQYIYYFGMRDWVRHRLGGLCSFSVESWGLAEVFQCLSLRTEP